MELYVFDADTIDENKILQHVSIERRKRVVKMRNSDDKKRGIAAELLRNYVLDIYLRKNYPELSHDAIAYKTTSTGKPTAFVGTTEIFFNISHSGKYVAIIIGDKQCGVDIERIREAREAIITRCYDEIEQKVMKEADNKAKEFTTIWTMKESFLKMTGEGIRADIKQVITDYDGKKDNFHRDDINYRIFRNLDGYLITVCYRGEEDNVTYEQVDDTSILSVN